MYAYILFILNAIFSNRKMYKQTTFMSPRLSREHLHLSKLDALHILQPPLQSP